MPATPSAGKDAALNEVPGRETGPWRTPGAVLLVSCYELGHQPIALASPLSFLRRSGYSPGALDLAVNPFSPNRAAEALFVGISAPMHTALRLGVATARKVRTANPSCHICFYGLYATLNAGYLLEHVADSVIGGEYETPMEDLVSALEDSLPPSSVPGVGTAKRSAAPYLQKISLLPPRREELPPLRSYAHLLKNGTRLPAGAVEASRGCKHLCLHCPIPPIYGGRFYAVPRKIVLEDIRALEARGAKHINFVDPDFLNGPAHAMRIARELHEEFPALTFDFTAKIEHLVQHEDLLPELGALGCAFIVTALESLSNEVLKELLKGHTRSDAIRAVQAARASKISIRPTLVSFTPWTTAENYLDVLDFVETFDLIDEVDPIQYAIRLLIPPGSSLLGQPTLAPHLQEFDPENFIHRWTHPDPRMDRLHEKTLAIVEEATENSEDPFFTFEKIRKTAATILERPNCTGAQPSVAPDRVRPPRLTESWFC